MIFLVSQLKMRWSIISQQGSRVQGWKKNFF